MKLYELLTAVGFYPTPFIGENTEKKLTPEEAKNRNVECIFTVDDKIYIIVDNEE